ncbi:hypothetical protein [Streptomyces sp. NPDC021020]
MNGGAGGAGSSYAAPGTTAALATPDATGTARAVVTYTAPCACQGKPSPH